MSDTAQQAWRRWWDQEGSAERPLPNEDTEQFAERITEIAWSNGAYARADEIDRLRAELAALVAERDALRSALAGANIARAALAVRIGKLESQWLTLPHDPLRDADRDLREWHDTMTKWMDQVTAMLCHSMTHSHDAKQELVTRCDAAIAAMRKGEA